MTPPARAAVFALGLLLLSACGPEHTGALVPAAAPRVAGTLAPSDERDHAALVASFGGEARAPAVKAVLDGAVERLVAHSERPDEVFALTVLDSPKVNAFALPSGRLYVTRGLLALANDESEIAAVLAHEMAHVTRRHAQSRSEQEARSALLGRVSADVLRDAGSQAGLRRRSRAALASFSREQEFEADLVGIQTLAAAGYDPFGAARFLKALGRETDVEVPNPGPRPAAERRDSSHPDTAERIARATAAAERLAGRGERRVERERWLSALDGLAYGDKPEDGLVRGRRFVHPGLGVTFTAPEGVTLENTPRAVLGTSRDGDLRLLFDVVDLPEGQSLQEFLAANWREAIEPGSVRTYLSGTAPVTVASSRGTEWTFRLAAARIGSTTVRLIVAARGRAVAQLDRERDETLGSLRALGPEEAAAIRPERIRIETAEAGDTPRSLAARMAETGGLDRFLVLNGLEAARPLTAGERYKIVGF